MIAPVVSVPIPASPGFTCPVIERVPPTVPEPCKVPLEPTLTALPAAKAAPLLILSVPLIYQVLEKYIYIKIYQYQLKIDFQF